MTTTHISYSGKEKVGFQCSWLYTRKLAPTTLMLKMEEWMNTHQVTVTFCNLCQHTRATVALGWDPSSVPAPRCCEWKQRPFTLSDLDYWTNNNINARSKSLKSESSTACSILTAYVLRASVFGDMLNQQTLENTLSSRNRTRDDNDVIVSKATFDPKPDRARMIIADHGLEIFLCPLKPIMTDYSDVVEANYPKSHSMALSDEHDIPKSIEVSNKRLLAHACTELSELRQWSTYLSVQSLVNENIRASNRHMVFQRSATDGTLCAEQVAITPDTCVHLRSCAWLNCWGPFAYSHLEDLPGYQRNEHCTFSPAMIHQRDQVEKCMVLWKAMSVDIRMRFVRKTCSFLLQGMNHMCSFMLHPVIHFILQSRNLAYSPEQLMHTETVELESDILMRYVCHSEDADFFRDPAVIRMHMDKLSEYCSTVISACHPEATEPDRQQAFMANVLLSWTHYRGMVCTMLFHALHAVCQDMQSITERALAAVSVVKEKEKRNNRRRKKREAVRQVVATTVQHITPPVSRSASPPPIPLTPPPPPPKERVPFTVEQLASLDRQLDFFQTCMYCRAEKYDCVSMPCRHMTSCQKCMLAKMQCPWCNKPVERIENVEII
jgi:hypothetical protein